MSEAPKSKPPTRQRQFYLVNLAALICLAGSIATGIALWLGVESGPQAEKYLWGWHKRQWGGAHLSFSLLMAAILAYHLIQHWRWIRATTIREASRRSGWRGAGAIMLVAAATLAATYGLYLALGPYVERGRGAGAGSGAGQSGRAFRGGRGQEFPLAPNQAAPEPEQAAASAPAQPDRIQADQISEPSEPRAEVLQPPSESAETPGSDAFGGGRRRFRGGGGQ
ncbi:MAG: hypothetical protein BWZ10_01158 [candidate division BRC1 bacterium ADurb.BinA364]|nr:MAG: hypothetical protein BWZ10_01158 [candidate division BRC1 bacterium ADurb.BinA364]